METIYTTTAGNAAFYQTLAVAANSEAAAREAFDAYLASDDNRSAEAYEFDAAHEAGDETAIEDWRYSYDDVEAHEPDEDGDVYIRFGHSGQLSEDSIAALRAGPGAVSMIDSGGNG